MSVECLVHPTRLRLTLKCTCCLALLAWIAFGSWSTGSTTGHVGGSSASGLLWQRRHQQHGTRRLLQDEDGDSMENITICNRYNYTTETECDHVNDLVWCQSKCDFVESVESCQLDEGLIDYLHFIYCVLPPETTPLVFGMIFLFNWLLFLFVFLGATAEEYFCPALKVMSQVLHLSQNVAGVTLLAFGNGAPDIFAAFAAITDNNDRKASLAIGALFGAGMFVTTVVVGAVAFLHPFNLTQRPFLRDIIFYMVATYWTFFLLWENRVTIGSAIGFVMLYVVYVLVVVLGRVVYQRWKKWNNLRDIGDIPKPSGIPEGDELPSCRSVSVMQISKKKEEGEEEAAVKGSSDDDDAVEANETAEAKKAAEAVARSKVEAQLSSSLPRIPPIRFLMSGSMPGGGSGGGGGVGSASGGGSESIQQAGPVIRVTTEDSDEDNPELTVSFGHTRSRKRVSLRQREYEYRLQREEELAGGSLPTRASHRSHSVRVEPTLDVTEDRTRGSSFHSGDKQHLAAPSAAKKHLHPHNTKKTISGALEVTEDISSSFATPHLSRMIHSMHRSHEVLPGLGPGSTQASDAEDASEDASEDAPLLARTKKRPHPFLKFLYALWPFGESFKELGIGGKIYEIVKSPANLLLTLTVPVIDDDVEANNWNKYLNVLHCVTSPMFVILVTKQGFHLIGHVFPVWTLILILSTIVAIVVACTSVDNKPPKYHCLFAWLGFAVSIVWIYIIANEIVNLLQAFGLVIKLSEGILGLTLLAWGNSVGDAVSNITMARQGFPRMAVGACFGGPLLNILLGIGIAGVYKTIVRRDDGFQFKLYFSEVELVASFFLLFCLASSLLIITVLRFKLRKIYGLFLLLLYVVFLVVAILAELQVIDIPIRNVITEDLE